MVVTWGTALAFRRPQINAWLKRGETLFSAAKVLLRTVPVGAGGRRRGRPSPKAPSWRVALMVGAPVAMLLLHPQQCRGSGEGGQP